MVNAAFFHIACCTFAFQFITYGVDRFLARPNTGHGRSAVQEMLPSERSPNTGAPLFQFALIASGSGSSVAATIVPPPGPTGAPVTPVGLSEIPLALVLFCPINTEMCGISKITPPPARNTVFPSPRGSHATPKRGPELL